MKKHTLNFSLRATKRQATQKVDKKQDIQRSVRKEVSKRLSKILTDNIPMIENNPNSNDKTKVNNIDVNDKGNMDERNTDSDKPGSEKQQGNNDSVSQQKTDDPKHTDPEAKQVESDAGSPPAVQHDPAINLDEKTTNDSIDSEVYVEVDHTETVDQPDVRHHATVLPEDLSVMELSIADEYTGEKKETDKTKVVDHKNPPQSTSTQTDRNYYCKECDEMFCVSYDLEVHRQQKHSSTTTYKCDYCYLTFNAISNLQYHTLQNHSMLMETQGTQTCKFCQHLIPHQTIQDHIIDSHNNVPIQFVQDLLEANNTKSNDKIHEVLSHITILSNEVAMMKTTLKEINKTNEEDKNQNDVELHPNKDRVPPAAPTPQNKVVRNILIAGDSITNALDRRQLERETGCKVDLVKMYTAKKTDLEKCKGKSFEETLPPELEKRNYDVVIIQGGSKEITELDNENDLGEKLSIGEEKIAASSTALFNIAEDITKKNPQLKVIINKRIPRVEPPEADPDAEKAKLSEYGNSILDDLWRHRGCPTNIKVQDLNISTQGRLRNLRYGAPSSKGWDGRISDGIHLRGKDGINLYTDKISETIKENFILPEVPSKSREKKVTFQKKEDDERYHRESCPQALYRKSRLEKAKQSNTSRGRNLRQSEKSTLKSTLANVDI